MSSSSSSPLSTWRSNSLFSPTYEAMTFFTCRVVSKTPIPKPSTPALFPTMVRPFTPLSRSAAMRFSGMPHRPNPPAAIVMLSCNRPVRASVALG